MVLLLRLTLPASLATSPNHHHRQHSTLPLRLPIASPRPRPFISSLRLACSLPPNGTAALSSSANGEDYGVGHGGIGEDVGRLLALLPEKIRRGVAANPELPHLMEIVMDLGRRPLARFPSGDVHLSHHPISSEDLLHAISQVGDFSTDNRAGISRTLHRISAIRNRKGTIIGLTCRVGRAVPGSANMLRGLVKDGSSLLLIGPPGVGKTTIIRDIARMLADDYKKRVMIVDTSNEIGGDGDIPHAGIGSARRLQVPNTDMQHKVLIEAVENHMPQVIVIDEIGTKLEAIAASTIAQRGIQLVATAHGVTIENLVMNPSLEMLVGGVQSVTLGDEEASRRGVQKTVLERKGPSTFSCGAEIISKTELRVHRNLEETVDAILAGRSPNFEVRKIHPDGSTHDLLTDAADTQKEDDLMVEDLLVVGDDEKITACVPDLVRAGETVHSSRKTAAGIHLYVYGILETSVLQAIKQLKMDEMIVLTDNISQADAFLALHSRLKKNSQLQAAAESHKIPIYVTKTNSLEKISKAIRALVNACASGLKDFDAEDRASALETHALEEARLAIEQVVIPRGESVQLLPRPTYIISVQVELIEMYKLKWEKVGQDPNASLRILPLVAEIEKSHGNAANDTSGGFCDFEDSGDLNLQNGITRLPLLPD